MSSEPMASTSPVLVLPESAPPPPLGVQPPIAAIDGLTTAIYGLQRQMGQFAIRLTVIEGCALPPASDAPVYGVPGYGGLLLGPPVASTPLPAGQCPVTQIQFPDSS